MELFAQKRFTGSYEITDEGGLTVALMQDYYYQDEKLARLMACAPELLEALEWMAQEMESRIHGFPFKQPELCILKAYEAIAKAKGEQQ